MIFKSQTPWPWRLLRIIVISAAAAWLLLPQAETTPDNQAQTPPTAPSQPLKYDD
ncbi:MAG: hypothetical protein Q9O24_05685 [Gammaproteobacteria bacterium]|nr:hypothetical protein [Gammaproteobacteria bacterium]